MDNLPDATPQPGLSGPNCGIADGSSRAPRKRKARAGAGPAGAAIEIIPAAPEPDILGEQFDFVVGHYPAACVTSEETGCPECRRLAAIKRILLERFN